MSQPAISKHVRVLERAGLIEQGRHAQWRPRRLRAGPLRDIADPLREVPVGERTGDSVLLVGTM